MTPAMRVASWVARKLGVQIMIAGQPAGMVDDESIAIWEKVRARGINSYTMKRATLAAVIVAMVWVPVFMIGVGRASLIGLIIVPLCCFSIVALLVPIRWAQHEDRFLRLTAPWVVGRFD